MNRRTWTDEQLKNAVSCSRSKRQVLIALGLSPKGGNYSVIELHISRLSINTSHFLGKGWNRQGIPSSQKIPLKRVLVKGSSYQSHKLKLRLIQNGFLPEHCSLCGWRERSSDGRIPLELDHINGDHGDNRLNNLRILCPNCHSLQPTHRGKNKQRYARVL